MGSTTVRFRPPRAQDASAVIAGFVYQAEMTILGLLGLGEDDSLELECGEDIDYVLDDTRLLEQVKARSEPLSLRVCDVKAALAHYHAHRTANPSLCLRFRLTTNAVPRTERPPVLAERAITGIHLWQELTQGNMSQEARAEGRNALRAFLSGLSRPRDRGVNEAEWESFLEFVRAADEDAFDSFLGGFEWCVGAVGPAELEAHVQRRLADCSDDPCDAHRRLLVLVFKTLSARGSKTLRRADLDAALVAPFDTETWLRLEALGVTREQLLRGLPTVCAPVDWPTSELDVDQFHHGVDVMPVHVAAGLVERREEIERAFSARLERHRYVLVCGPSGAGKSAVLWSSVYATRDRIRWFRVFGLSRRNTHQLIEWLRRVCTHDGEIIGLVADDLGRHATEGWQELVKELASFPRLKLAGAVRNEDLIKVAPPRDENLLRPELSDAFAERLWAIRRSQGQTAWAGWREPLEQSGRHFLEYIQLLMSGKRLRDVVGHQVQVRQSEKRDDELELLRLVATAGLAKAPVLLDRARALLGVGVPAMQRALQRLVDEHLVAVDVTAGTVTGLHELRSAAIFAACHEHGVPRPVDTVQQVLSLVPRASLPDVVEKAGVAAGVDPALMAELLAAQAAASTDISLLASSLEGLARLDAALLASRIASIFDRAGVPPLLRQSAFLVSSLDDEARADLPEMHESIERAAPKMHELMTPGGQADSRVRFLTGVEDDHIIECFRRASSIDEATRAARYAVGVLDPSSSWLEAEVARWLQQRSKVPLEELADFLLEVTKLNRSAAERGVDTVGRGAIRQYILEHRGDILHLEVEARALRVTLNYHAPISQGDPHELLLRTARLLVSMFPSSDSIEISVLTPDGRAPDSRADLAKSLEREPLVHADRAALNNLLWRQTMELGYVPATHALAQLQVASRLVLAEVRHNFDLWLQRQFPSRNDYDRLCRAFEVVGQIPHARRWAGAPPGADALLTCVKNLIPALHGMGGNARGIIERIVVDPLDVAVGSDDWGLLAEVDLSGLHALRAELQDLDVSLVYVEQSTPDPRIGFQLHYAKTKRGRSLARRGSEGREPARRQFARLARAALCRT